MCAFFRLPRHYEVYIQPSIEIIRLGINNIEPSFEENLEMIKKDEVLQHIEELKLKDDTFQEIEEDIK